MLSIRRGRFVIVLTSMWGVVVTVGGSAAAMGGSAVTVGALAAAVGVSAAATTGTGPSVPSAQAAGPDATAASAPDESSARDAAIASVDSAAVGGAIGDLAGTVQDPWSAPETDQLMSRSLYLDCDHVSCLMCGGDPSPRTRYGCGCGEPGYAASHEVAACQACVIRTSTMCTIHMTLWI